MALAVLKASSGISRSINNVAHHLSNRGRFANAYYSNQSVLRVTHAKFKNISQSQETQRKKLTGPQVYFNRPLSNRNLVNIRSSHRFYHNFHSNSSALSNGWLLKFVLVSLFLTALAMLTEAQAESVPDEEVERINALLKKKDSRTLDEKIELFNYLLKNGEKEAKKSENKDIVIFLGNTGAGKSTLINFLYGCKMIDVDGAIVVDPQSPVKEVAVIGTTDDSCTYIPKKIPDITIKKLPVTYHSLQGKDHNAVLAFFDMPGLTDNRGIEVALATTIVMKQMIEHAKSVRFVMVFEHGQLNPERGQKWREAINLLEERFNNTLGRGENSLCLVITRENSDIDTIKKDIKKYVQKDSIDLSDYAFVYNPLNSDERQKLLGILFKTRAYEKLATKVSMGKDQLWEALKLGDQVQEGVSKHLDKGHESETKEAVRKIQFTYGIAKLGNKDLTRPHESAEKAVQHHVKKITDDVNPLNNHVLQNQIEAFNKYKKIKNNFSPFVSFDQPDRDLRLMIKNTEDPRWVAWEQPQAVGASTVTTVACVALAICASSAIAAVGAVIAGAVAIKAFRHWWNPSQEEKDKAAFFNGP